MRIDDILQYWGFTRGAGHSQLSLGGISKDTCFIFVGINSQQCEYVRSQFPKVVCMTVKDEHHRLYGLSLPLLVDHAALAELIRDEQHRLIMMGRESKRP